MTYRNADMHQVTLYFMDSNSKITFHNLFTSPGNHYRHLIAMINQLNIKGYTLAQFKIILPSETVYKKNLERPVLQEPIYLE
jgi:hypothetical protein